MEKTYILYQSKFRCYKPCNATSKMTQKLCFPSKLESSHMLFTKYCWNFINVLCSHMWVEFCFLIHRLCSFINDFCLNKIGQTISKCCKYLWPPLYFIRIRIQIKDAISVSTFISIQLLGYYFYTFFPLNIDNVV